MSVGISCFVGWSLPEQMMVQCGLSQLFSRHVVLPGVCVYQVRARARLEALHERRGLATREAALDHLGARQGARLGRALQKGRGLASREAALDRVRARELGRVFFALDRRGGLSSC